MEANRQSLSKEVTQLEWYEKLIPLVKKANFSIDITHHEPRLPYISGIKAKKELFDQLTKKIKQKKVMVRWLIAVNSQEKYKWLLEIIDQFKHCDNLNLSHCPVELKYPAPPLSIQLIDNKIAFAIDLAKGHHSAAELDTDIITEDIEVVKQFKRYYETYWNRSIKIKEGGLIHQNVLEELKKQYNS